MSRKHFKAEYLAFSRKERTGILALFLIILIIYLIPLVHSYYAPPITLHIDSTLLAFADSAIITEQDRESEGFSRESYRTERSPTRTELFAFDPNLATKEEWLRLGLSEKTTLTIDRYRKKGGRFYKKEDLQRIWGLPPGFYERVKDHMVVPERERNEFPAYEKAEYVPRTKTPMVISVNAADSGTFERLPGIGPRLSARIVGFREKLGGFYTVEQVGETYGLPDSTFQKIRPLLTVDAGSIRRININTATKEELRSHPYIRWNLANAIVAYRMQHGNFFSVDDLKKVAVIDEKTFEKIYHYLRIE
jgi:competence protein ComEA